MTKVLVSFTALLASVAILLVGHGLQLTLIPLYADQLVWDAALIGYIGSSYYVGFMLGCFSIPALVARVGHIRVFAVLAAIATASLLSLTAVEQLWFWMLARVLTGWSIAGLYMVIESWLNEQAGTEQRGMVLSTYTVITLVGLCVGQLLIGLGIPYRDMFMLAAIFVVLSIIPVGLTASFAPTPIPAVRFRLAGLLQASQVAVVGAFIAGVVTSGFWALGPVVARANGLGTDQVGIFMAITIAGGAVFQLPIGRLSDQYDRRYVIAAVALLGVIVCTLAAFLAGRSTSLLYMMMFVFGAMTFPLYSLCLAHANDNTELPLMEIASGILMMTSAGAVLGPVLVGWLIDYNNLALFYVSGLALLLLAAWTGYRIRFHDNTREHFEPFVDVPRTTHEIVELMVDDCQSESSEQRYNDDLPDR
ncbi:MAG: MFS transporter [Spongiibacteraceae bacterium]